MNTTEVMELANTPPLFAYLVEARLADGSSRRATLWCVDLREAIKLSRFMFKLRAVIIIDGAEAIMSKTDDGACQLPPPMPIDPFKL